MPKSTAEYSQRINDHQVSPTAARILEYIQEREPELNTVIIEQATVHHSQAVFTIEVTTLSYDRDGAAIEVMDRESTAHRLFEAMRDALGNDTSAADRRQAARDLIHLMTIPHQAALAALETTPDAHQALRDRIAHQALRNRLAGRLDQITQEAAQWLSVETEAHSITGERFCDQTERLRSISRDLEHASRLDQPATAHFDGALLAVNPGLWKRITQGENPGIFPKDGNPNPRAQELLDAYNDTVPGWSWEYGEGVRKEIVNAATGWLLEGRNGWPEPGQEQSDTAGAEPASPLRRAVERAGRELHNSLRGTPRQRAEPTHATRFHDALQRIADLSYSRA